MTDVSLLIFDFDGVLRNMTWEGLCDAYQRFILAVGKDPNVFFTDVASFHNWYDINWHRNEERIFETATYQRNVERDILFHKFYDGHTKLFSWVPEVLETLSKKYLLAILSSSRSHSILNELGEYSKYFSEIAGAEHVSKLKPDPEGVYFLLRKHNVMPGNAIMIGDMAVDVAAGRAAGTKTGVVKWGMGEWPELCALQPEYVFETHQDLLKL